jgi:hypothetical protein
MTLQDLLTADENSAPSESLAVNSSNEEQDGPQVSKEAVTEPRLEGQLPSIRFPSTWDELVEDKRVGLMCESNPVMEVDLGQPVALKIFEGAGLPLGSDDWEFGAQQLQTKDLYRETIVIVITIQDSTSSRLLPDYVES